MHKRQDVFYSNYISIIAHNFFMRIYVILKKTSLVICRFYSRWKETETLQAQSLHFTLDENQWSRDWAVLLSLASQPGGSSVVCWSSQLALITRV